ncbi:MAG TPA: N-terminal phage integrase SAM-like domain-containing protein, partial [Actinomycetota bacterium]|nr:N-terminal phage integrase SAM-like domain-containing protein [Actinomycetota bacterium]
RKAKVRFVDFATEFLEAKKLSVRPATQSKYESALKHLVAAFGSTPIGKVARSDVQAFIRKMSECYASATVRIAYTWKISRPTAARWVAKAREKGYLGRTTERHAGERSGIIENPATLYAPQIDR